MPPGPQPYATFFADLEKRRLLYATPGREEEVLEASGSRGKDFDRRGEERNLSADRMLDGASECGLDAVARTALDLYFEIASVHELLPKRRGDPIRYPQ